MNEGKTHQGFTRKREINEKTKKLYCIQMIKLLEDAIPTYRAMRI